MNAKLLCLFSLLFLHCAAKPKSTNVPGPAVSGPSSYENENKNDTATDALSDELNNYTQSDEVTLATFLGDNNTLYFEFNSSELTPTSKQTLDGLAEWLRASPQRSILIEGHTDEIGTTEYNLGLGERRAIITKNYLTRLGVEPERVDVITFGEERPAGKEDHLNRRSVIMAPGPR